MITRRGLFIGAGTLLAAPAIVPFASLMKPRVWRPPPMSHVVDVLAYHMKQGGVLLDKSTEQLLRDYCDQEVELRIPPHQDQWYGEVASLYVNGALVAQGSRAQREFEAIMDARFTSKGNNV
jgi:hypothetical protein